MAKLTFELSWNYDEAEYLKLLQDNNLAHLKSHGSRFIKTGDAFKSSKGVIARVVDTFPNYENLSYDITIANNKLSIEEMYAQFQPSVKISWEYPEAGCPKCGSYEGDYNECPECGHGQ